MNKKNWLCIVLACAFTLSAFNSCKKDEDNDNTTDNGPTEWVRASAFDGDPRSNAASFQIDNKGFLATGILTTNERTKDAWSFENNVWKRIADFPGAARNGAVGFAIGENGYVGLGYDGTEVLKDFYKYNPSTNTWTQIASLPANAEARYGAVAFTLGNQAYVGLGATKTQKTLKDFWKYDATTDKWEPVGSEFKQKRVNAFAFVIGNKAYVGGGFDNNQYPEDFYSFDGTKWSDEAPLKDTDNTYDLTRQGASAFVIGNFGYVVGGKKNASLNTVWKYDPAARKWESKHQALPQNARDGAVTYSIGGKGYLATGANGSMKFDDNWVFTPVR
ncbi:Kelch repeat-containing protein [Sphingobacterium cavernae]|uniref:Kelch repeat-containing protein n=1 Tax=Sphingobacterium cavernae TaxID=2592657 RepID=UPI00122FF038|nr:kelch repeat-containing protein [Sphingobacterium cavernae]